VVRASSGLRGIGLLIALAALGGALLLVAALSGRSSPNDDAAAPDILWLGDYDPLAFNHNFTTHGPDGEPGHTVAGADYPTQTVWMWSSGALPSDWSLSPDNPVLAVLFVSGLADAYAVPTLGADMDGPLVIDVNVELLRIGAGSGEVAGGSGSIAFDPLAPAPEPVEVRATLVPYGNVTFHAGSDGDGLALVVSIPARGRTHSPLRLHVLGEGEASYLSMPGFPVDGFRTWEDTAPGALCRIRAWNGEPCVAEPVAEVDPSEGDAPLSEASPAPTRDRKAPAFVAVILTGLVALLAGVAFARRPRA